MQMNLSLQLIPQSVVLYASHVATEQLNLLDATGQLLKPFRRSDETGKTLNRGQTNTSKYGTTFFAFFFQVECKKYEKRKSFKINCWPCRGTSQRVVLRTPPFRGRRSDVVVARILSEAHQPRTRCVGTASARRAVDLVGCPERGRTIMVAASDPLLSTVTVQYFCSQLSFTAWQRMILQQRWKFGLKPLLGVR